MTNVSRSQPQDREIATVFRIDARPAYDGVREHGGPEAFFVVEPADAMPTAHVLVTEALGADSVVFLELPCRPVVTEGRLTADAAGRSAVMRLAARIPPHRAPREEQPLPLATDPRQLHWFDPATGAAI